MTKYIVTHAHNETGVNFVEGPFDTQEEAYAYVNTWSYQEGIEVHAILAPLKSRKAA